jgi:hypothetical protein
LRVWQVADRFTFNCRRSRQSDADSSSIATESRNSFNILRDLSTEGRDDVLRVRDLAAERLDVLLQLCTLALKRCSKRFRLVVDSWKFLAAIRWFSAFRDEISSRIRPTVASQSQFESSFGHSSDVVCRARGVRLAVELERRINISEQTYSVSKLFDRFIRVDISCIS